MYKVSGCVEHEIYNSLVSITFEINKLIEIYIKKCGKIPTKIEVGEYVWNGLCNGSGLVSLGWQKQYFRGIEIDVVSFLPPNHIVVMGDFEYSAINFTQYNQIQLPTISEPKPKLPEKYIINDKATILFWKDGTKTIVKKSKKDIYDPVKGFLWSYFLKHCGMSRTKANKYLAKINENN